MKDIIQRHKIKYEERSHLYLFFFVYNCCSYTRRLNALAMLIRFSCKVTKAVINNLILGK